MKVLIILYGLLWGMTLRYDLYYLYLQLLLCIMMTDDRSGFDKRLETRETLPVIDLCNITYPNIDIEAL